MNDCGYRIKQGLSTFRVTSWIDDRAKIIFTKNKIKTQTCLFKNKFFISSPLKHFSLRFLSLFLGNKIVCFLKKLLIFQNEKIDAQFTRLIEFMKNKIIVDDKIEASDNFPVYKIFEGSMRVVPSANFFSKNSIYITFPERLKKKKVIKIKRVIMLV